MYTANPLKVFMTAFTALRMNLDKSGRSSCDKIGLTMPNNNFCRCFRIQRLNKAKNWKIRLSH